MPTVGSRFICSLRRGWVSSQQLISPPGQRKLHLLPDLINLVVDLSKCKGSVAEITQLTLADLTFNRRTIIVYTPQHLSSILGIVGHRKQDFDTGAYLSSI
jgi:hypothetical protein